MKDDTITTSELPVASVFEMLAVRVRPNGLRIDFTEPLALETIKASRMPGPELANRVTVTNAHVFDSYNRDGQSVILVGAHLANWEWFLLACSLALPMPLAAIYRPLHSGTFDRFVSTSRTRFGARLIPDRHAVRDVMATHGDVQCLALLADQRPARSLVILQPSGRRDSSMVFQVKRCLVSVS